MNSPPNEPSRFPDIRLADEEGLVGYGGELEPDWLLDAYRHGVFPWPSSDDEPVLWWSPDPRAVIELDGLQISRRLRRRLRSGCYTVTLNQDFADVLRGCATGTGREGGTWLTPHMQAAYTHFHQWGHAHSVEAWLGDPSDGELVGGVYGVAIGGAFAAESMFHRRTDASKVALAHLVAHLQNRGYGLLDIQQWTEHTGRLGAVEISRDVYLDRLASQIDLPITFGDCLEVDQAKW